MRTAEARCAQHTPRLVAPETSPGPAPRARAALYCVNAAAGIFISATGLYYNTAELAATRSLPNARHASDHLPVGVALAFADA